MFSFLKNFWRDPVVSKLIAEGVKWILEHWTTVATFAASGLLSLSPLKTRFLSLIGTDTVVQVPAWLLTAGCFVAVLTISFVIRTVFSRKRKVPSNGSVLPEAASQPLAPVGAVPSNQRIPGRPLGHLDRNAFQKSADGTVAYLRSFISEYEERDRVASMTDWQNMTRLPDGPEKQSAWHRMTTGSAGRLERFMSEYDRRFKADTIILRDELLYRSATRPHGATTNKFRYEDPINSMAVKAICDDLDMLKRTFE